MVDPSFQLGGKKRDGYKKATLLDAFFLYDALCSTPLSPQKRL